MLDSYGDEGAVDWKPYPQESEDEVYILAEDITADEMWSIFEVATSL